MLPMSRSGLGSVAGSDRHLRCTRRPGWPQQAWEAGCAVHTSLLPAAYTLNDTAPYPARLMSSP